MSFAGPEKPPRLAWGLYRRMAVAGALIVLMTSAAVSTAALLEVKETATVIRQYQSQAVFRPKTIDKADAGEPQTILLVGSDKRYGAGKGDARSDTLMLVRLDPDQSATSVLSIPRDLVVDIPGHGRSKINAAYSYGGLDLTARTVKQLMALSGRPIKIHHAIGVNFAGFRKAVNYLNCVYVDVDRRYYHSNVGLPPGAQYAEIDIQPGYQPLCGQRALDFVRFRHGDNDLVRAARQQDFLRASKDQLSTSRLIGDRKELLKIFGQSTEADADFSSSSGIRRLLTLAVFSAGHPVRRLQFPATFASDVLPASVTAAGVLGRQPAATGLGDYITATPDQVRQVLNEFLHASGEQADRKKAAKTTTVTAKSTRKKKSAKTAKRTPGDFDLVDAETRGKDLVALAVADRKTAGLPVYVPAWLTRRGTYPTPAVNAPMPFVYTLRDRSGKRHRAYRIVVTENAQEGQYYGVQGTTWKNPPILSKDTELVRLAGRTYRVSYDGSRIRTIGWKTRRGSYWVSNTLTSGLSNLKMLGLARSLTRVGPA